MRLLVNATSLLPPVTGIGRYTFNLMRSLSESADIDARYLYSNTWSDKLEYVQNSVSSSKNFKRIFKAIVPRPYKVAQYMRQVKFDRGVKRYAPDLYHEPNYIPFKFAGPTVVTIHDLSVLVHPESHPKDRVEHYSRQLPEVIQKANAIAVDSEYIRNELLEYFDVPPEKVFTTLLGVEKGFRPYDITESMQSLGRHALDYKGYMLVVGTLEPRKNLLRALECYQELNEDIRAQYPLVIAGMRGWNLEHFAPRLQGMVDKGQVRLLGYVPENELYHIYSGAKLFLFPSKYEGFGLPPLEAMASGVPVIASNRASIPEVVGDAGILLEPDDTVSWSKSIDELLRDEQRYRVLSQRSLTRSADFTWGRCAEQTLVAYEYALGRSIARRKVA